MSDENTQKLIKYNRLVECTRWFKTVHSRPANHAIVLKFNCCGVDFPIKYCCAAVQLPRSLSFAAFAPLRFKIFRVCDWEPPNVLYLPKCEQGEDRGFPIKYCCAEVQLPRSLSFAAFAPLRFKIFRVCDWEPPNVLYLPKCEQGEDWGFPIKCFCAAVQLLRSLSFAAFTSSRFI